MTDADASTLTISAEEAKEHDLPAAAISVEMGDVFMQSRKFPGEGVYVSMSGPPGAPLGMAIQRVPEAIAEQAEWERFVEKQHQEEDAEFGVVEQVEFAGAKRSACTFTTGESMARTHHLAVCVEVPGSEAGILIHFWQAAGKSETPAPAEVVRKGRYAELLQSISVAWD